MSARTWAGLALVSVTLTVRQADAFCRTTTCDPRDPAQHCEWDTTCNLCEVSGIPLSWPTDCVSYGVQQDGSVKLGISYDTAKQIFDKAFISWLSADCGGGQTPAIDISPFPPIVCGQAEYNQSAGNANVWIFRDDAWPYPDGVDSTIALTTITYNTENGQIYDADVEINSFSTAITTTDLNVKFDLQSVATHEAGHFLGLSHSCMAGATMTGSYNGGNVLLRTLETDDIAGICAAYPPGRVATNNDCQPRHGFSRECAPADSKPICSCLTPKPTPSSTGASAGALLTAFAFATRRMRRRKRG